MCPWSLALASSIPVLGLESVCPRKGCPWPWPWPRIFFVSLALALASSLVSSTPPLVRMTKLLQSVCELKNAIRELFLLPNRKRKCNLKHFNDFRKKYKYKIFSFEFKQKYILKNTQYKNKNKKMRTTFQPRHLQMVARIFNLCELDEFDSLLSKNFFIKQDGHKSKKNTKQFFQHKFSDYDRESNLRPCEFVSATLRRCVIRECLS